MLATPTRARARLLLVPPAPRLLLRHQWQPVDDRVDDAAVLFLCSHDEDGGDDLTVRIELEPAARRLDLDDGGRQGVPNLVAVAEIPVQRIDGNGHELGRYETTLAVAARPRMVNALVVGNERLALRRVERGA